MKIILLCLTNVILMASGQMIFKLGTKGRIIDSLSSAINVMLTPVVLVGLFVYACATILWLYILSKVPISFAYPIQALAFPLVLLLSTLFFKETISISRWIGIALIMLGTFIAVR